MVEKHLQPTRRFYEFAPVTGLAVDSVAVDLVVGSPAGVTLLVEEPDDLEKVMMFHEDGILNIALDADHPGVIVKRSGLAIAVASTSVNGTGTATIEPLQGVVVRISLPDLPETSLQGAASFSARNVAQSLVTVSLLGSGSATLQGQAEHASVVLNGAGEINADELNTAQLAVRLDGSGTVSGCCSAGATAALMGSGQVMIRGSVPQVDYRLMGSGQILHIGSVPPSGRLVSDMGTGSVDFRASSSG